MSNFQINYNKEGDSLKIDLVGNINEDVIFDKYPLGQAKKIDIDMSQVKGINSCGIREWIKWFSNVQEAAINFIGCPRVMIEQFNMIDSVKPKSVKIISFYVPYYNEEKNLEKNILYERGKNFDDNGIKIEQMITDEEGNQLEIDVLPNKYFQFLTAK